MADVNKPALKWWQTSIIYQIYPRSFKDSNGDGIGDLPGIISKLDYFVYLGVKAIWLSPFYPSPCKDFGYDISNFVDVDPMFGTLEDFKTLLSQAHEKGINVIVDFVPNHSSDQHRWFQASVKRIEPYTDYYIWSDGKIGPDGNREPPNNWLSVFGGTAWNWNEERQQYYYHAFVNEQPDLNYRNPKVVEEMNNVVKFWAELGVDGLRVDAITNLFEVEDLSLDDPLSNKPGIPSFQYEYLDHKYTANLPETGDVIRGWRNVLDEVEKKDGKNRFMVVEIYETPENRNAYLGYGCDLPFNFDLIEPVGIRSETDGRGIKELVDIEYSSLPKHSWPNFVMGNHDRKRISARRGVGAVNAFNMLLLTLKGTPTTYYGEEIGMEEIEVSFEEVQDPWGKIFGPEGFREFTRDPVRSPLQWTDEPNSGFTSGSKPWLPVHPDYKNRNIKTQMESKEQSPIQLYRQLARLREEPSFQYGHLSYAVVNSNIFSYLRKAHDHPGYLVAINFGKTESTDDYISFTNNSKTGTVIANTGNFQQSQNYQNGNEIDLNQITLKPDQGLVIQLK